MPEIKQSARQHTILNNTETVLSREVRIEDIEKPTDIYTEGI